MNSQLGMNKQAGNPAYVKYLHAVCHKGGEGSIESHCLYSDHPTIGEDSRLWTDINSPRSGIQSGRVCVRRKNYILATSAFLT